MQNESFIDLGHYRLVDWTFVSHACPWLVTNHRQLRTHRLRTSQICIRKVYGCKCQTQVVGIENGGTKNAHFKQGTWQRLEFPVSNTCSIRGNAVEKSMACIYHLLHFGASNACMACIYRLLHFGE